MSHVQQVRSTTVVHWIGTFASQEIWWTNVFVMYCIPITFCLHLLNMRIPRTKLHGFPDLVQKVTTLSTDLQAFIEVKTNHSHEMSQILKDVRLVLDKLVGRHPDGGIRCMMQQLETMSTSLTLLYQEAHRRRPGRLMETLLASVSGAQISLAALVRSSGADSMSNIVQSMLHMRDAMHSVRLTIPTLHAVLSPQEASRFDQSSMLDYWMDAQLRSAHVSRFKALPEEGGYMAATLHWMQPKKKALERGNKIASDILQQIIVTQPETTIMPARQALLQLIQSNSNLQKAFASLMRA